MLITACKLLVCYCKRIRRRTLYNKLEEMGCICQDQNRYWCNGMYMSGTKQILMQWDVYVRIYNDSTGKSLCWYIYKWVVLVRLWWRLTDLVCIKLMLTVCVAIITYYVLIVAIYSSSRFFVTSQFKKTQYPVFRTTDVK